MTSHKSYHEDDWQDDSGHVWEAETINEHAQDHNNGLFTIQDSGTDVSDAGREVNVNFRDNLSVTTANGDIVIDGSGGSVDDSGNALGGTADHSTSLAVHPDADVGAMQNATAVGNGATVTASVEDLGGSAIGYSATADGWHAHASGRGASAEGQEAIAVGTDASCLNGYSVTIGYNATDDAGGHNTVVGNKSDAGTNSSEYGVAVGNGASCGSNSVDTVAIGAGADIGSTHSLDGSIAIGRSALVDNTDSSDSISIGRNSTVTASDSVAIGGGASVATANVARIDTNQFVFGGVQDTIADADLNNSELTVEMDESNGQFVLRGKDSSGNVQTATIAW